VDVPELLATLRFEAGPVERLRPQPIRAGEALYETPAAEFALSVLSVEPQAPYAISAAHGVAILLCTRGSARIVDERRGEPLELARGSAALVPAAAGAYRIEGGARIYKATTPM
jgi:mannose-6-phosphate isomerase